MKDIKIIDEMKRLSRRIEEIGKILDLLFKDREILEDILTRLSSVENALHLQRSSQTEMAKNIKADIGDVQEAVEAKIDEATVNMDEKTLIVKSPTESVIQKIIHQVSGR